MAMMVFPFDTGAGSISNVVTPGGSGSAGASVVSLPKVSLPQTNLAVSDALSGFKSGSNSAKSSGVVSNPVQKIVQGTSNIPDSALNNYADIINAITKAADSNTAKSIELAKQQNNWQIAQNAKAMEFSADEAKKQREWQEMMSNTSYQRAVKDLQAAGLNPVLAALNSGAVTPSGASASGVTSSGTKGSVDTSVSSSLGNFLTALINSATAVTTAGISSAATLNAAKISAETQYRYQNLTTGSSLLNGLMSLLGRLVVK